MLKFTRIAHPSLTVPWLLTSLDEAFAAGGDRLDALRFAIEGDRGIEDRTASYEGYVFCEPGNADGLSDGVRQHMVSNGHRFGLGEDEKDHVPAFRRMERQTADLRHRLPIPYDVDGQARGDWTLVARPGMLRFLFDARRWGADAQLLIAANATDAGWAPTTEIRVDVEDGEEVDLDDPQALLAERFDPGYFRIAMPQALSVRLTTELDLDEADGYERALLTGRRQLAFVVPHDSFVGFRQSDDDAD
jgi:hypothetical protein